MKSVYIIAIVALLFILFFKIIGKSFKLIFKLALNTIIGIAALILLNMAGSFIGVTLGVNLVNGLIVGILGIPGVLLLLLLQWLCII